MKFGLLELFDNVVDRYCRRKMDLTLKLSEFDEEGLPKSDKSFAIVQSVRCMLPSFTST